MIRAYALVMAFIRTLVGGTLFLILLGLIFWIAFSNATPVMELKLAGLTLTGQAFPNPFASVAGTPLELPFSAWLMIFAVLGMLLGLVVGWFMGGGVRVRARKQGKRARQAEKDLKVVKTESEVAKTEVDALKGEKKDLETKVKAAEAIAAPSEIKRIANS